MTDSQLPISAWRTVLEGQSALMRLYEQELRDGVEITLGWYDVLIQLAESPERSLRMSELADRLLLSPSWLTRRIDGMVAAGVIQRGRCPEDGRGVTVSLTPVGEHLYRRAARVHGRSIREHFLDLLEPAEAETLVECFARVGAHARAELTNQAPTKTRS
ncbi:MAG: MarR family winged helix-turn-helix transcriptional regulator [Acidimicrobiales bacterium]